MDPGTRKCHLCKEDQEKWATPIPNCDDPDGEGIPCPYPKISRSLNVQNITAWEIWTDHADSLISGQAHMAGVTYTLNLDFLKFLFENLDLGDKMIFYKRIKTIFDVWSELQYKQDNPKTKEAMSRTKSLQRIG